MKSNVVVLTGGRQVRFAEIDVPDPAPSEITLETLVTLMSMGTEMICYRGESDPGSHWDNWVQYPFYPGYSNVGRVIKVGSEVENFSEGDRVFSTASHRGHLNLSGGEPGIIKVPEDVTSDNAVWCTMATITQTSVRQAEHIMGDTAVVIGCGPIGQLVTQYLKVVGLRSVLVIDQIQARLDIALAHGATASFCGSVADAKDAVLENTEGELADVVYDATGHHSVLPLAFPLARRHGKVILLGDSPHPTKQHLTSDVLTRQLRLIGTQNYHLPPQHAVWTATRQRQLFLQYVQRGQMSVSDLITHRFSPNEAASAYAQLDAERGGSVGAVFDW